MKILFSFLYIILLYTSMYAEEVFKDMLNRDVKVPQNVQKVFAASPPMHVLLYALAPDKMIGSNYKYTDIEKKYMLKKVANLPVLGSFYSTANQSNLEKVLALRPDFVFMWDIWEKKGKHFEDGLQKFQIPLAYLGHNTIEEMVDAIQVAGKFIGEEKRAQELSEYAQNSLDEVSASVARIKDEQKKRIYLADGVDGLSTECDGNLQSQIVMFTGGINVHKCTAISPKHAHISLEQLYKYDPDIIFVRNPVFFKSLDDKSSWRNLRAFKERHIYFSPVSPFNWMTRPPSIMRFLGITWMHYKIYPEHFKVDINKKIKDFYKLFLHVQLSDKDLENLLKGE